MAQRLPDQSQPGPGSADPHQPVVGRGGDGDDGDDDACASPRRRGDALHVHDHDDRDVLDGDAVLPLLLYSLLWIYCTVQVAVNSVMTRGKGQNEITFCTHKTKLSKGFPPVMP